jgi:protein-disulfide isomerase
MSKNTRSREAAAAAAEKAKAAAAARAKRKRVMWINIGLVGAFVVAVALAFIFLRPPANPTPEAGGDASAAPASVVRENSHVLGEPGAGDVTLVEFLDFECEACGAFYPIVEELRKQYAGQVTFVTRYFPLDGHKNSRNAAVAAEAAAQQGAFEQMYNRLFETQSEWGEQSDSRAPLFREFATEIGLDMAAYDAAVSDPATLERVVSDFQDGLSLGVQSTPTFFLNGERLELQTIDDLPNAIDAALKE